MTDRITLELPALTRYISTVRLAAVGIAAELDFDTDAIEELRMGANELIALAIEAAEADGVERVQVTFLVEAGSIEIMCIFNPASPDAGVQIDPLAEQILHAVADDFSVEGSTIRLLKRRTNARV